MKLAIARAGLAGPRSAAKRRAVMIVLAAVLAFPSLAGAEILNPPGGPVVVDDEAMLEAEAEAMPVRGGPRMRGDRQGPRMRGDRQGPRMRDRQGMRGRPGPQAAQRQQLRRALIAQFDLNGDGRLGPRERVRAARVLRRLEQRLMQPAKPGRAGRDAYRRTMRRYDVNGDGQVGPREMPRGAADRLRPLDRDRDGWVEPGEL